MILHETPETPRDFEFFHDLLRPKACDVACLRISEAVSGGVGSPCILSRVQMTISLLPQLVAVRPVNPRSPILPGGRTHSLPPSRLRPTHQEDAAAAAAIAAACSTTTWLLCPRTDTREVGAPNPYPVIGLCHKIRPVSGSRQYR